MVYDIITYLANGTKNHQKTTKEEVSTDIRSASVRSTSPSHQHATQGCQAEKESTKSSRCAVSRHSQARLAFEDLQWSRVTKSLSQFTSDFVLRRQIDLLEQLR